MVNTAFTFSFIYQQKEAPQKGASKILMKAINQLNA